MERQPCLRMSSRRRASIAFVLATLGLDALGLGLISPIVPRLVQTLGHLPPNRAAPWIGALIAAYAGVQFLAAPLLGELSDRFGRRPVILVSVLGLGCDYLFLALAPSVSWLFVGRLIAGATSANVPAATAYIADISSPGQRSGRFGLIGATFGAGFVIGPALGGLLGTWDLRLPFYAAAGLSLLNFAFGLLVLPESLPGSARRSLSVSGANRFRMAGRILRDRSLGRLALAWSCSWVGLGAVQSSLVLYTGYRFGWGTERNGAMLAVIGTAPAAVEGLLLQRVNGRFGERRSALIGYGAGALGYAGLAMAVGGWSVLPAVLLIGLGSLATPSVRAMVAARGQVDTQGEMQGLLSAVEGLTATVAPLLATGLFYAFTAHWLPLKVPGAPFLLAAGCAVMAALAVRKL